MQHVFIIGAKGVSFYGGYESFVQKLLEYHRDNTAIQYHVSCKANGEGCMKITQLEGASEVNNNRFVYYGADCFLVSVPEWMGAAQAIAYDVAALKECCKNIEENQIDNAIVYVLACRIGPFISKYAKKIHQLGGKVYLNPDGHEWKRAKWPALIQRYWKESERLMVKNADVVICDSINIEKYIKDEYTVYSPKTVFIPYGAEVKSSAMADNEPKYVEWLQNHGLRDKQYYVSVGRFVPENNFETMIREFMKSRSDKDFAIITTENPKLLQKLDHKLHFSDDKRIKFVGTMYDQKLLRKIRENAYGYIHGHSVGGTNPSLLEALGSTKLNLLYKIGFNEEVAGDSALYWTLEDNALSNLIDNTDYLQKEEIENLGNKAKQRIVDCYSWEFIVAKYEKIFCLGLDSKAERSWE